MLLSVIAKIQFLGCRFTQTALWLQGADLYGDLSTAKASASIH